VVSEQSSGSASSDYEEEFFFFFGEVLAATFPGTEPAVPRGASIPKLGRWLYKQWKPP
jgi:hypothetical protein